MRLRMSPPRKARPAAWKRPVLAGLAGLAEFAGLAELARLAELPVAGAQEASRGDALAGFGEPGEMTSS